MNEVCKVVFGLAGGLALFLYGMNSMSDALQKAAGEKMKKILEFLTKNPIMGVLAGALVTAVLQSSSATTVMVIGFVSAGLMSLPQAISVIFGANIGTTMTAQLMAFKITDYIYPIIFVGFMLYFASKKEKVKNVGLVIFSFGLLFEGIEIMGSVMKPLANSPIFRGTYGESIGYSGAWCSAWCRDDAGCTEQFSYDCGAAEFCVTAWTGWSDQCDRSGRSNSDFVW